MVEDTQKRKREGAELVDLESTASTSGQRRGNRRHSKDRSKGKNSTNPKSSGKEGSQEKKKESKEEKSKEDSHQEKELKEGKQREKDHKEGNRSTSKNGESKSDRRDQKDKEESKEERNKNGNRDKGDRTEDHKQKDRRGYNLKEGRDRKHREKSSRLESRRESSKHSSHHSHSSRSKRSEREDKHRKRGRSSERHRSSRHSRHHRESGRRYESKHATSKRKRSAITSKVEDERDCDSKRSVPVAAEPIPSAGTAAGVSNLLNHGNQGFTEMNGTRVSPAAQKQNSPHSPPPVLCAPQPAVKDLGSSHAVQQRGRAVTRASPSPPRGGIRYKSRSNSRGRERRSPSYGAYRGREASAEKEESNKAREEQDEGEGEDEDEVFDLSLTGGRFSELLDQEVTCSVVGGEIPIPEPADTLDGCKDGNMPLLNPLVVENLKKMKCRWLLPIQRYAIPIVAKGHDLLGSAATGCGKTLAFLAPLVSRVIGCAGLFRPHFPGSHAQASPLSVVLCPTRELAIQIDEQLGRLMAGSNLSHSLWIGGVSATDQVHEINQRQIDVAICTPGRVDELCLRGKVTLEFVQLLVLDEADAMLDLGFQKVMTELATSRDMPENRQTLLFSATFPPNLQSMLPSILRLPYFRVDVGKASSRMRDETAIRQEVKWVEGWNEKLAELVKDIQSFIETQPDAGDGGLPGEGGQVIVFVSGKNAVKGVADHLRAAKIGTETLFGAMQQEQRKQVYLTFRSRKVRALVATSVAARGLDFPDVGLVINFEMPPTIEPYVHRIGRTGRAGRSGQAISYFSKKDTHLAVPLVNHLTKCKAPIPPWLCRLVG